MRVSWLIFSFLGALTIQVVLHESIVRFVVVDELDDLKQVLFLKLHQSVGHLLDIEWLLGLLAAAIDLARFTVLVTRQRPSLTQDLLQALRGVLEGNDVGLLVAVLLEIEVVGDGDLAALVGVVEVDVHLKFAPSLVFTGEGRGSKGCGTISKRTPPPGTANGQRDRLTLDRVGKGGVEIEDDLGETVCLVILSRLIDDEDLHIPFTEWEALRGRRLVLTISLCQC